MRRPASMEASRSKTLPVIRAAQNTTTSLSPVQNFKLFRHINPIDLAVATLERRLTTLKNQALGLIDCSRARSGGIRVNYVDPAHIKRRVDEVG